MADGKQACEKCGCPMEFIMGPNGKAIPVQKVRTAYISAPHDETVLEKGIVTNTLGEKYKIFYVSHFETCSDPGRFSRHG